MRTTTLTLLFTLIGLQPGCGFDEQPPRSPRADSVAALVRPVVGVTATGSKWPTTCSPAPCRIQVTYRFDPRLAQQSRSTATKAMLYWEKVSNDHLEFIELAGPGPAVEFALGSPGTGATGFSDSIGKAPSGQHILLRDTAIVGMTMRNSSVTLKHEAVILTRQGTIYSGPVNDPFQNDDVTTGGLPLNETMDDVLDIALNGGVVYAWWKNGHRTKGTLQNLTAHADDPYTAPYSPSANLAITVYDGAVYSWWEVGGKVKRLKSGTSTNLGSADDAVDVSLPPGKTAAQIVGMAISPETGKTYTWFSDGTYTVGSTRDLDQDAPPASWKDHLLSSHAGRGTAVHEIGHALGMAHEQQRSDRDHYVQVGADYADQEDNYGLDGPPDWHDYTKYDFASIMHYGPKNAPPPGQFLRWNGDLFSVQKDDVSWRDLAGLMKMYDLDWTKADADAGYQATDGDLVFSPPAGFCANDIIGADFAPSGQLYSWYNFKPRDDSPTGQLRASGHELQLDADGVLGYSSSFPASTLVAVAIAKRSSRTYAWFLDLGDGNCPSRFKRTIGSTTDLAVHDGGTCVTTAPGHSAAQIVDMAIDDFSGSDRVYTLYTDGAISVGSSLDLTEHRPATSYTGPAAPLDDVVAFALRNGAAYFFRKGYQVSIDKTFHESW